MADPGFTAKDIVTLAIAATSLVVTIGWNLWNRAYTDRVARKIRSDTFKLDEWKSQRDEVMRTLRAFESAANRVLVLAKGAHPKDELIVQINAEGSALTLAHLSLDDELTRNVQPAWPPRLAYGAIENGESDWDRLSSILREVGALDDPAAMRTRLTDVEAHVDSISKRVNAEIEHRNAAHRPA